MQNNCICSIEGCPGQSVARGLCWKHYMRVRRYGNASFRKRRYGKPPKCRYCGTRNPDAFYHQYKSVCKRCKKLKAISQRMSSHVEETPVTSIKLER